ncbi:MAG TPA: amidohydrolase family protein [Microbacterium sp.]|uniref:amidohydrolase family protein n=1 Tax=Microbacterium sp. TaxID=51671 RepID=UPI002B482D3C|nr:amidohydrolase family protein [Microbacterium sp.]HKT55346.1 amidohydrolase family protein [Microbacterium sp.]
MSPVITPDLVVVNGRIYTVDAANPWAEAFAVRDGRIRAIGDSAEIRALAGPQTEIVDAGGRFIMPGLVDVHLHLDIGGQMLAWELIIDANDTTEQVMEKVRAHAANLRPGEWVVGGVVGSIVVEKTRADASALDDLDEASLGHPVLLRDTTMHNRWLNTAALAAMGITTTTPDLNDEDFIRDAAGRLTGWVFELDASALAETALQNSITDPVARDVTAVATSIKVALHEAGCSAGLKPPASSSDRVM